MSQEHHGKKTAGIDGVKALTPLQRLALVHTWRLGQNAKPVRRVWFPTPDTLAQRPFGIPVRADRALQAVVKSALEPAWEARFDPNSDGCRPGSSYLEASAAMFTAIGHQATYVLDADLANCFDRIDQSALLTKVHTSPSVRRQLKAWRKAWVLDDGQLFPTQAGPMHGGTLAPLLANMALHGLETGSVATFPRRRRKGFNAPNVLRYADDCAPRRRGKEAAMVT